MNNGVNNTNTTNTNTATNVNNATAVNTTNTQVNNAPAANRAVNTNIQPGTLPQTLDINATTKGPEPVITKSVDVPVNQIVSDQEIGIIPQQEEKEVVVEKPKKKINLLPLLIILILFLIGGVVFLVQKNKADIERLIFECSPVGYKEETTLDLNSTLVQDLYNKVKTNIKEDLASVNLDNSMKLYLAYRQIGQDMIYSSNCNLFSKSAMEPYTCPDIVQFMPMAFKEETMQLAIKKLFGEDANVPNANVQLGNSCIGGYEYIKERGEYVKGYCEEQSAIIFRADKKLVDAKSYGNYITLTEEVKYIGNESAEVPSELVSGTYVYTFKLDTNYNYIYISKEKIEKYK